MTARIVTFYSFKGGVGRSQALANVALELANREEDVLMVDFDLESPGLDRYFRAKAAHRQDNRAQRGHVAAGDH